MIDFGPRISDNLPEILREYLHARQLCDKQQERLALHVRVFEEWRLSRDASGGDTTTVQQLNAWLSELAGVHAPATVNGYRQSILSLLRFATEDGDPLPRSDRIRRQRTPEKINVAFTRDEIRTMIAAARHYQPMTRRTFGQGKAGDVIPRHRPDGVPWSVWWAAFVRVGYESGQYLSDLRRIPWVHVGADGVITFVRHKTGRSMSFRLSPQTIEAAAAIGHPELLLPWEHDMAGYFPREWRKFTSFAGVRTLGAKSLRRSAITYTYMHQGEEAARLLAGHASFATTAKHYIDWSIARRPIIEPPPL